VLTLEEAFIRLGHHRKDHLSFRVNPNESTISAELSFPFGNIEVLIYLPRSQEVVGSPGSQHLLKIRMKNHGLCFCLVYKSYVL